MEKQKSKRFLKGTIEDVKSGKIRKVKHYPLLTDLELASIIKITKVEFYNLPDLSLQILVVSLALDSIGMIFDMALSFTPKSLEESKRILKDMKVGSLWAVKGEYGMPKDAPIILFSPFYRRIQGDVLKKEIKEAFCRHNQMECVK